MSRIYPQILRGTAEYDEVRRFLGGRARDVADGTVRQVSNRHIIGQTFIRDQNGDIAISGDRIPTRRFRMVIPRDSWMRGRK